MSGQVTPTGEVAAPELKKVSGRGEGEGGTAAMWED
jgi:hypothetical protein